MRFRQFSKIKAKSMHSIVYGNPKKNQRLTIDAQTSSKALRKQKTKKLDD